MYFSIIHGACARQTCDEVLILRPLAGCGAPVLLGICLEGSTVIRDKTNTTTLNLVISPKLRVT